MTKREFQRLISNLKEGEPRYMEVLERYKREEIEERRAEIRHRKMVMRFMALIHPVRHLKVSSVSMLSDDKLIGVGKAAKALYEELDKAKLLTD